MSNPRIPACKPTTIPASFDVHTFLIERQGFGKEKAGKTVPRLDSGSHTNAASTGLRSVVAFGLSGAIAQQAKNKRSFGAPLAWLC